MANIRKLRKEKGLTQKQLAKLVDVTESQISQIENGKRNPGFELLLKLGEVFDCDVDDIVRDKITPATESDGMKENKKDEFVISEWDKKYLAWLHAQSPEKRRAILILQDAPEDLL